MVGWSAKNFFGAFAHHYVYNRKFISLYVISLLMLNKLNKINIF